MILSGSKILTNTWKQELQVREDGVYGEILVIGKRIKMHLPYENIAQVNISRGILASDMTIINKGGTDNLTIKALNKAQAEKAKELIQKKIEEVKLQSGNNTNTVISGADEIAKLADLKDKGILTEDEFQAKKIFLWEYSKYHRPVSCA